MFRKSRFHALIREDRIRGFALLAARAHTRRDALLHRSSFALYAEHFGPSGYADGFFVARRALREVDEDAKRGCEAVPSVGDGGRIVCDQGAEFGGCGLGLGEDVETDGCCVAKCWVRCQLRSCIALRVQLLFNITKGLYTYYGVSLSYAHVVAQFVEGLHILLSAFAHGYVFYNEAFVAPGGHGFDVEFLIFGGDVQYGRTVLE